MKNYKDFLSSLTEEERMARADFKVGPSGRKSHKEIVFKDGSENQEKDDKLKREEVELEENAPVAPGLVKHRISVTVSDPDHTMVSKRKEKIQKTVIVTHSDNKEGAQKVGEKYYKKKGYRVHDSHHAGMVNEETISEADHDPWHDAQKNKKSAEAARKQGDTKAYHMHMADHHENMAQWSMNRGRHAVANQHQMKADNHHDWAHGVKEEVELEEGYDKTSDHHKAARSMARDHGGKATFNSDGTAHVRFNDAVTGRSTVNPKGTLLHTGSEAASRAAKDHGKGKVDGSTVHFKEEVELDEAIKLGSKVKVHAPGKDYHGEVGYVGEIRHGAYKGAPKTYTVDYGDRKSVQLDKKNVKLHKEEVELEEGYVVKYHDNKGVHKNTSKVFDDKAKAAAHASKGNSIDKVGGKYSVHKIDTKGHEVNEATDTVQKDKDGKVVSWKHEGDWKKADKKDPRGKVTHASDVARRRTEKLTKEETMEKITYKEFLANLQEQLLEYTPGPGGVTRHVGTYGTAKGAKYGNTNYDDERMDKNDDEGEKKTEPAVKRGRGRPAGSKSGANQKVTSGKSYGGFATHSLHLPNSNK